MRENCEYKIVHNLHIKLIGNFSTKSKLKHPLEYVVKYKKNVRKTTNHNNLDRICPISYVPGRAAIRHDPTLLLAALAVGDNRPALWCHI